MFQGYHQVYSSTMALLAQELTDAGMLSKPTHKAYDILSRVLGEAWSHAATHPIKVEGNYQCVLRNNHIVHVQALHQIAGDTSTQLMLTTPMYAALDQLTLAGCNTMPPKDEDHWFHIQSDGTVQPFRGENKGWDDNDPPPMYFRLRLLAGPNIDCRTPIITTPQHVPTGVDFRAIADRLVNAQAEGDSQIVWYRSITAPPHYTKVMVTPPKGSA
jgi:hypothetical protein